MKFLFPLVTTAFVGTAGASIYYSVRSGNGENDSNQKEPGKLVVPEVKGEKEQEPEKDQDIPNSHKPAAKPDSEKDVFENGEHLHVVERVIS